MNPLRFRSRLWWFFWLRRSRRGDAVLVVGHVLGGRGVVTAVCRRVFLDQSTYTRVSWPDRGRSCGSRLRRSRRAPSSPRAIGPEETLTAAHLGRNLSPASTTSRPAPCGTPRESQALRGCVGGQRVHPARPELPRLSPSPDTRGARHDRVQPSRGRDRSWRQHESAPSVVRDDRVSQP